MKRIKKNILDIVRILFTSSYSFTQKLRLLFDYIKLTVLNFLNNRVIKVNKVKFLGFKWVVRDFGEFCLLVSEIFVEEPYVPKKGLKNVSRICDCGSNIGMSILYFKYKNPSVSVEGFEPDPEIYNLLIQNIKDNGLEGVVVHNVALSDQKGEISFFKRDDLSIASSSLPVDSSVAREISVNADTLSNYLDKHFDYLKMDIQFSESRVFADLADTDKLKNVSELVMEYHYRYDVRDNNMSGIVSVFEKKGFDYRVRLDSDKPNRFRTYIINAEQVEE